MTDHPRSPGLPDGFEDAPPRPPAMWELLRETRVVLELASALVQRPRLVREAPRGTGEPVLVVPGFATTDHWTARLRAFVAEIGYRTYGWGLGRNHGNVEKLLPRLIERAERIARDHGRTVRVVGWSLGGYLAREVARERPDLVERVVTLGAPVVGGPSYTASAPRYVRRGYDLDKIRTFVRERERRPIAAPVFAVFSRQDGVVAWRACVDVFSNPRVEHHEVSSSHLGLVVAPQVFDLVADLLARPLDAATVDPTGTAAADGLGA